MHRKPCVTMMLYLLANISPYCSQHDRKFQNYCPQHESIGCPLCIQSNHANCLGILSLENVIQTAKTSVLFESLAENLKYIKINAEKIEKDRKQNLAEIKNQSQKFHDEIKQIRKKFNEHLDILEQRIIQDLYAEEVKVKSKIEDLLGKIAENTGNLDLLQTYMLAIKEYASDLQTFLGSKMMETEIKKHETFIQSLFEDGSLQKIDLNCKIEDKVSNFLSIVASFGSISVEFSSPIVVLQTEKDKQVQTRARRHTPPTKCTRINDIKMTLKRKFELDNVIGCCFSSTGDIFLVDNRKQCLFILKEDETVKTNIHQLSSQYPVDVTCINDKTVAVSFPSSNQIQVINIFTKKTESTIKTTSTCFGICYRDGHLIYCNTGKGIEKVNVSGNCSSTLIKDNTLTAWSFLTTSKDKILYTNRSNNAIACYNIVTREKMWEYKDQSVNLPFGIAVDKDSNIYIASYGNNNIIVLSPDGKQARKMYGKENGISQPYGLAFDERNDKLIVANSHGTSLYELC